MHTTAKQLALFDLVWFAAPWEWVSPTVRTCYDSQGWYSMRPYWVKGE